MCIPVFPIERIRLRLRNALPASDLEPLMEDLRELEAEQAELRRASESAQKALSLHTHILAHTPNAVFVSDAQGHIVYANATASQQSGYSPEELRACDVWDVDAALEPESYPGFFQGMNRDEVRVHRSRHYRKNGQVFDVEIALSKISFGEEDFLCGIARDLTEQLARETILQRTQFSVDRAPYSIFWISPEGRFLYVNQKAAEALGYTQEELLTLGVEDVDPDFPPDSRPERWAECRRMGASVFESRHRRKDGKVFPVRIHSYYLDFQNQEVEVSEVEDISEYRAQLERQSTQLRYSQALNRLSEGILHQEEAQPLLDLANQIIGEALGVDRILIYDIDFQQERIAGLCEWLGSMDPRIAPTLGGYTSLDPFREAFKFIQESHQALESQAENPHPLFRNSGADRLLHEELHIQSLLWFPFAFDEHGYYLLTINQILQNRPWQEEDLTFLDSAIHLLSLALMKNRMVEQRTRAMEALRQNESRLESLIRILQSQPLGEQQLLDQALDEALQLTQSQIGYIYFYNEERKEFILNSWSKEVMEVCSITEPKTLYHLDQTGIWGEAVRQRKEILLNDFLAPHPHKKGFPQGHAPLKKFLTIPVFSSEKIVAVVGVANKDSDYDQQDVLQLKLLLDGVWKEVVRRRVEIALRQEQAWSKKLIEAAPNIVIGLGERSRIMVFNQFAERLTGYRAEEVLGQEWIELFIPQEIRPQIYEVWDEIIRHRWIEHHFENEILTRSGEKRLIAWDNTVLTEDKEFRLILSMGTDITAQRQAEAQIRLQAMVLDQIQDMVTVTDLQGMITYVNEAEVRALGYPRTEILGSSVAMYGEDPERGATQQEIHQKTLEHGTWRGEVVNRTAEGQEIILDCRTLVVRNEQGQAIALAGISTDITQLKQMLVTLESRERMLANAAHIAKLGPWELDIESGLFTFNDAFYEVYRTTAEREGGYTMPMEEYARRFMHPEDAPLVEQETRRALETTETNFSTRLEHRIRYADGQLGYISVHYYVVKDSLGRTIRTYGVNRDITDQKESEQQREQLQSQLFQAQKLESIGRLAGGVAHDFNNMLAVILGMSGMLLEQLDPGTSVWEDVQEIRKAAERSANLTRQLLAFARKQTIQPRILDLNVTVEGMLKMLRRIIGENIRLNWHPGPGLWSIRMDPSQIDQILANLCVNARDAISAQGTLNLETANVLLGNEEVAATPGCQPGPYVRLSLEDDGQGMDADTLEHIFEPFFSTKGVGQGTGLGLATVHGIVRQNLGLIRVFSQPGQGSLFQIFLPASPSSDEKLEDTFKAQKLKGGQETILLVEDEGLVLNLTEKMLKHLGYDVLAAQDPKAALRIADQHSKEIQLLLTDMVMPGMKGLELWKQLKLQLPTLQALFMSGYTPSREDLPEGRVSFLQKPFTLQEMAQRIRAVLDLSDPS